MTIDVKPYIAEALGSACCVGQIGAGGGRGSARTGSASAATNPAASAKAVSLPERTEIIEPARTCNSAAKDAVIFVRNCGGADHVTVRAPRVLPGHDVPHC